MILNAIKQMERAARLDPEVVSLSQGIPFRASSANIRQSAIEAIVSGRVDRYSDPQGIPELREVLSMSVKRQGMEYSSDEIMITAGAIEGLNAVLHTLVSSERNEVVMPVPVYAAYSRCVAAAHGTVRPVRLVEAETWRLDRAELIRSVSSRTAAILICNPNNPTGSIYDRETLEWLLDVAYQNNTVLITDEVYTNMRYEQTELFSPAMIAARKRQVIRIVSFSKDFALTGWRVGFVQADRSHMSELVAVHDTLVNCAPVVSQYAALAAVQEQTAIIRANAKVYTRHRRIMREYLERLGPRVSYTEPGGAYFFFVRITGVNDVSEWCLRLLAEQKVAVVPGDDFGPGGEGHVRLCFGRSEKSIRLGMERFSWFVRKGIVG